jgi:hypothetical protein
MNTKIRTAIITLIAAGSFAATTVAPAVSQAQPIDRSGGAVAMKLRNQKNNPCPGINTNLSNGQQVLGDSLDWKALKNAGEANATKGIAEGEAAVNIASGEAFEAGCDPA